MDLSFYNQLQESKESGSWLKTGIIPKNFIIAGSASLCITQIILGTDLIFAVAISLSIFFGLFATNVLGGLKTVTGLATAAMLFKLVVLSQFMKVFLLQKSDSILTAPIETAMVFMVGFFMIFLVKKGRKIRCFWANMKIMKKIMTMIFS